MAETNTHKQNDVGDKGSPAPFSLSEAKAELQKMRQMLAEAKQSNINRITIEVFTELEPDVLAGAILSNTKIDEAKKNRIVEILLTPAMKADYLQ
jgi:hypothetical protein